MNNCITVHCISVYNCSERCMMNIKSYHKSLRAFDKRVFRRRREKRDSEEAFFHNFVTFGGGCPRNEETVEPLFPVMQGCRIRWWAWIRVQDMRKLRSSYEFPHSVDVLLHSTAHLTTMASPRLWTRLCDCFPCISIDMLYQFFITPNIASVPICDVITFTFH